MSERVETSEAKQSDLTGLLSSLSPVEVLELGWCLRGCLDGHIHDGRDVARALLNNPVLAKYADRLTIADICTDKVAAVRRVKMAITEDLAR